MSWDDFGDFDLSTFLSDYDFGDFGGDLLFDTDTGQFVDPAMVDPADIVDYDFGGLPEANVPGGPSGTSLSDQLRSRAVDPYTEGSEDFDWNAMADPSASIASANDGGWMKAIAQGIGNALGGLGGGLSGLGRAPGAGDGGGGLGGGGGLMGGGGGGVPGMLGPLDAPGLQGLIRAGMQEPIGAAYTAVTPTPRAQVGMQAPIDPGPAPVKFTPLQIPLPGGGTMPMAGAPGQRLSGLQRLMLERLG